MTSDGDDQGPIDKVKEVGEKAADKIEPDGAEVSSKIGADQASDPFAGGERADEQAY